MKHIKEFVVSFVAFMIISNTIPIAFAANDNTFGICGDNLEWEINDDGVLTISGTGNMYDYECKANWGNTAPWYDDNKYLIKEIVINEGVESIGEGAFSNCYYLKKVSLPNTLQSIGDRAFYGIYDLDTVYIPLDVTYIGYEAFSMCRGLETVFVDENNPIYSSDDCGVLYNKDKETLIFYPLNNQTTQYVVDKNTKYIADYAFYNCDNFISIDLGENLQNIGDSAFSFSDGLQKIFIPESVKYIGERAFSGCNDLNEIIVDKNNLYFTNDENGVMYNKDYSTLMCYPAGKKELEYEVMAKVKNIGHGAFINACLIKVVLPEGLEKLESYAFEYCMDLTSINLPSTLTFIGHDAFFNNNDLESIFVPENVETIEYRAFYHIDGVVFFEGNAPKYCDDNLFSYNPIICCQEGTFGWDNSPWNEKTIKYINKTDDIGVVNKISKMYNNTYKLNSFYAIFSNELCNTQLDCYFAIYDGNKRMEKLITEEFLPTKRYSGKIEYTFENKYINTTYTAKTMYWDSNIVPHSEAPYFDLVY